MSTTLPQRKDVPVEHTWDTTSVFESDAAWERAVEEAAAKLPELAKFQGRLSEGPTVLADWLEQVDEMYGLVGKIGTYAMMRFTVDTSDQEAAALNDRSRSLFAEFGAVTAFAEPEMLAIGTERLMQWADAEPRLAVYRHHFDVLGKMAAHVRSAEVEELLSLVQDPFRTASSIHGVISDADLSFRPAVDSDGNEHTVADGTIGSLLQSTDRELRRTAWESYADAYIGLKNGLANALAAGVKQNVFMARARRFRSALEAAVTSNHIPVEVFHNLIETYRKHLPTWHRYWRVRRRALGYDKLFVYDTRAALTTGEPEITYEQAVDWIAEGMRPLGDEYVEVLKARLPGRAVGRPLPQPRQTGGSVFRRLGRYASIHFDEFHQRPEQPQHLGPRAGALDALVLHPQTPAPDLLVVRHLPGGSGVQLQSSAGARPPVRNQP